MLSKEEEAMMDLRHKQLATTALFRLEQAIGQLEAAEYLYELAGLKHERAMVGTVLVTVRNIADDCMKVMK